MNDSAHHDPVTTLLSKRDVLVLSPHMDDAMLSASAVVLDGPVEVWTLFTGRPVPPQTTSWDLSCGFADSDATISARVLEDDAAFAGLAATNQRLGYLEGAYATRDDHRRALDGIERALDAWMSEHPAGLVIAPVCAGRHMPPAPWEGLVNHLRRAPGWLRAYRLSLSRKPERPPSRTEPSPASPVVRATPHATPTLAKTEPRLGRPLAERITSAPKRIAQRALHAEYLHRRAKAMDCGLAANPDHVALRDLALDVAARHPDVRLALYEDLPYLWHARGDDEATRLERATGVRTRRIGLPVDVARKHERIERYASQLPVLDPPGRLLDVGQIPNEEIYWLVEGRSMSPRPES